MSTELQGAGLDDTLGIWLAIGAVAVSVAVPGQPCEDLGIDILGTVDGKSASRVTPVIPDAPGAVVPTSNTRDVVDTRSVRADGAPVWVLDPQRKAQEKPTWWPVSCVTDEEKAHELGHRTGQPGAH